MKKSACYLPLPLPLIPLFLVLNSKNTFLGFLEIDLCIIFFITFSKISYFPDDPYYCGLRARIPNFAKSQKQKDRESK